MQRLWQRRSRSARNLTMALAGLWCVITGRASEAAVVFFPTTGSYYEVVDISSSWTGAVSAAAQKTHEGRPGRLATINSAEENTFVVSLMTGPFDSYWVGGYQDPNAVEPGGGWRWITDEPFAYTNWRQSPLEPNEFSPNEDFLDVHGPGNGGTWNDLPDNSGLSGGYVIEYAVPEPSSIALLGVSVGVLIMRARRHVPR